MLAVTPTGRGYLWPRAAFTERGFPLYQGRGQGDAAGGGVRCHREDTRLDRRCHIKCPAAAASCHHPNSLLTAAGLTAARRRAIPVLTHPRRHRSQWLAGRRVTALAMPVVCRLATCHTARRCPDQHGCGREVLFTLLLLLLLPLLLSDGQHLPRRRSHTSQSRKDKMLTRSCKTRLVADSPCRGTGQLCVWVGGRSVLGHPVAREGLETAACGT